MMHPDFERTAELACARYEDMRLSALRRAAMQGRRSTDPTLLDHLLARMGRLLVAAGSRLERRLPSQAQQLSLNL